jgi:hypothetical protein
MYGKMTTSRIGIIGKRFVSDRSFEVSMKTLGTQDGGARANDYAINRPFPIV